MPVKKDRSTYICFGNIEHCKNILEITMCFRYADGTTEEYSGIEMLCNGRRASNVTFFPSMDKLAVSVNADKLNTEGRTVKEIELSFCNPAGTVESLCLKYGFSAFDTASRRYVDQWEQDAFRHEKVIVRVEENYYDISFGMRLDDTSAASACEEIAVAEKSEEDVYLCIQEDKRILSAYSGDDSKEATELLAQAEEVLSSGDIKNALQLIEQAEQKLCICIDNSMKNIRLYHSYME